jgi:glutamate-1-semialdehyde 2,1-aminomutase
MEWFVHPDPAKRVLLAGTYNAHPVPVAAAIATIQRLLLNGGEVYRHVNALGDRMEQGIAKSLHKLALRAVVARQGSAFCVYFMDHCPEDWHDLAAQDDFALDERFRRELIDRGIYLFPCAAKQCSISFAHEVGDIEETLQHVESVLGSLPEE